MRIKLTQESRVLLPAGTVVEVKDYYGARLINLGRALEYVEKAKPVKEKAETDDKPKKKSKKTEK